MISVMPSPLGFIILHCLVFVLFPVTFSGICLLFSQVVWSCPAKGFNLFDHQKYSLEKQALSSLIGSATSLCNI
jgi:hypothetical protein